MLYNNFLAVNIAEKDLDYCRACLFSGIELKYAEHTQSHRQPPRAFPLNERFTATLNAATGDLSLYYNGEFIFAADFAFAQWLAPLLKKRGITINVIKKARYNYFLPLIISAVIAFVTLTSLLEECVPAQKTTRGGVIPKLMADIFDYKGIIILGITLCGAAFLITYIVHIINLRKNPYTQIIK